MNYKPVLDRILLKRVKDEKGKFLDPEGRFVKADSHYESNKYEVLAVGDFVVVGGQRLDIKEFVHVGDIVLVPPYNIEEVELDGHSFQSCRVQDVRGKQVATLATSLAS